MLFCALEKVFAGCNPSKPAEGPQYGGPVLCRGSLGIAVVSKTK